MKLIKVAATLGTVALLSTSAVATAEVTRAVTALPATGKVLSTPSGIRGARRIAKESNLIGAPLVGVMVGAVAITAGTIVVTNNVNKNDSPGG